MTKPPSIARFEQLYWASVIIGLVNTALNWTTANATLAANPVTANYTWMLPVGQAISLGIAVLLWFFIVRRPSVVAKWVQVVFAAIGAIGLLYVLSMLAMGRTAFGMSQVVGIVINILYVAAAVMLFKPDAKLWFGEGLDDDMLDDTWDAPRV